MSEQILSFGDILNMVRVGSSLEEEPFEAVLFNSQVLEIGILTKVDNKRAIVGTATASEKNITGTNGKMTLEEIIAAAHLGAAGGKASDAQITYLTELSKNNLLD